MIAYLDDLLIIGKDRRSAEDAFRTTKRLFETLGFVVNEEKSVSQASQEIEFLGFVINSKDMMFRITTTRMKEVKEKCRQSLRKNLITLRELAHLVGVLTATQLAIMPAPLHYRALQAQKNEGVLLHSYDTIVTLNTQSREDLHWWVEHLSKVNGRKIHLTPPSVVIESDASNTGWGAYCRGVRTRGQWSQEEMLLHINCKEMLAAFLALQTFVRDMKEVHVRIKVDNTTTMYYINHMGGTHSPQLMKLTHKIWTWCLDRKLHLSAEHLPGKLNVIADQESRMQGDSSEWKLSHVVFQQLMMELGPCSVDLFASRLTAQLDSYMSWKPDPGALATDALSQQWTEIKGYAFPPSHSSEGA